MEIEGFILRNIPFRNHDGILTILSKEAYSTVHARGILKITSPWAAATSLGAFSRFQLTASRKKLYLSKAELLAFPPMPDQVGLLASTMMQTALQIASIHDDTLEAPAMFTALNIFRSNLEKPLDQWLRFLITYLQIQGVPFEVHQCVRCHRKTEIVGISRTQGGLICRHCLPHTDAETYPASVLKALLELHHPNDLSIDRTLLHRLVKPIHEHFRYHLDLNLEGLKTIEQLIQKIHS